MTDTPVTPGEMIPSDGEVTINANRSSTTIQVRNTGDRPIQIGSHFHFFEVNKALEFDREAAFGTHLDIPAGTAVRFEPGEEQEIQLVEMGGKKRVTGLNNLTDGSVNSETNKKEALRKAKEQGYLIESEDGTSEDN